MRLFHYSWEPVGDLHNIEQRPAPESCYDKPHGFWVSVEGEDDWPSWCRAEGFRLGALTHVHEVVLTPDARLLIAQDAAGIDALTARYGTVGRVPRHREGIDWGRVARDYQGVIIAPYVGERRLCLETTWYYPWDCASGCIWDVSAIASVKLVEVRPAAERVEG